MERSVLFLFGLLTMVPFAGQNSTSAVFAQAALSGEKKDAKILVAYFSRADENYGVGFVEKGNTQIIAEYIADYLKADSFHIRTVTPYPKNYRECTNVALEEQKKKARPALAEQIGHLTDCNSLFCIGERM